MKLIFFFFSVFVSQLLAEAQEKAIFRQYYHFESICSFVYTTNKSTILSLYNDSSFTLETYMCKQGTKQLYIKNEFSGRWQMKYDKLLIQYLNQTVKTVNGNKEMDVPSLLNSNNIAPAFYIIRGDQLIADAVSKVNLHNNERKGLALAEKWAYQNALRIAKFSEPQLIQK